MIDLCNLLEDNSLCEKEISRRRGTNCFHLSKLF